MFNFDSQVITTMQQYVQDALTAFLPLLIAILSVFVAFAIARMLQFFIKRML